MNLHTLIFTENVCYKAKYVRVTAKGKGEDMILTINQEIT